MAPAGHGYLLSGADVAGKVGLPAVRTLAREPGPAASVVVRLRRPRIRAVSPPQTGRRQDPPVHHYCPSPHSRPHPAALPRSPQPDGSYPRLERPPPPLRPPRPSNPQTHPLRLPTGLPILSSRISPPITPMSVISRFVTLLKSLLCYPHPLIASMALVDVRIKLKTQKKKLNIRTCATV